MGVGIELGSHDFAAAAAQARRKLQQQTRRKLGVGVALRCYSSRTGCCNSRRTRSCNSRRTRSWGAGLIRGHTMLLHTMLLQQPHIRRRAGSRGFVSLMVTPKVDSLPLQWYFYPCSGRSTVGVYKWIPIVDPPFCGLTSIVDGGGGDQGVHCRGAVTVGYRTAPGQSLCELPVVLSSALPLRLKL